VTTNGAVDEQFIVIDFEYAAPNPRGYDIANHFHEWRANYHHPTLSHSLQPHYPYPSIEQRNNYYRAYLSIDIGDHREKVNASKDVSQDRVDALEREVRLWSPACSVFWSIWGIVQAEEQVAGLLDGTGEIDFDYLVGSTLRQRESLTTRHTQRSVWRCSGARPPSWALSTRWQVRQSY